MARKRIGEAQFWGMIVVVLISGFLFISCRGNSSDDNMGFTITNGRLSLKKYPCSFQSLPKEWTVVKPSIPECQAYFQRDGVHLAVFVYPDQDPSELVSKLTESISDVERTMPYEPLRRTFGKEPPYFGLLAVTNNQLKDKQGRAEAEAVAAESFAVIPINGAVLVVTTKSPINPDRHVTPKEFKESPLGKSAEDFLQFVNSIRLSMPSPLRRQSRNRTIFPEYGFSLGNLPTTWRSMSDGADLLEYEKGSSVIRVSIQNFGPYTEPEFLTLVDLRSDPGRRNFKPPVRHVPVLPGQHELVGEYTFGSIYSLYAVSLRDRVAGQRTETVYEYAALVLLKNRLPNPRTALFTVETVIPQNSLEKRGIEEDLKDFQTFISSMEME